jgi:hypothetical protein
MSLRRTLRGGSLGALLAALLTLLFVATATAQTAAPPKVTVELSKTRVTVGDPIQLIVTIQYAADVTITTTGIDAQLAPFEPLSSQPPQQRSSNGALQLVLRYTIAAYHTGTQQLPPIVIGYTLADGTAGQAQSAAPLVVNVESVVPPGATPTDIRPLKPQGSLAAPASLTAVWIGLAALAVLALLLAMMAFVYARRRTRGPALAPALPPVEAARAELQRIFALDLPAKGETVQHYRLLGACIRAYLASRFALPATTLTSSELAEMMERRHVSRWAARLVSGLLSECDAVVYARYAPAPERLAADNAMAFAILDAAEGVDAPVSAVPAGQRE